MLYLTRKSMVDNRHMYRLIHKNILPLKENQHKKRADILERLIITAALNRFTRQTKSSEKKIDEVAGLHDLFN